MLKDIKISNKLALMLTIPMFGLLYFSISISWEKQEIARQMNLSQELVELAIKSSSLVHELQKERGLSAGLIGSKATKFITELKQQRLITDKLTTELNIFLQDFNFYIFAKNLKNHLDITVIELDKIILTRKLIDKLDISLDKELKFYTNIIDSLIMNISHLSTLVNDAKLSNQIVSYVNLLQAKEKAGIERAILNNVFSKGIFAVGMYERFILLTGAQDNYIKDFFFFATPVEKQIYKNVINQNKILLKEFTKIRKMVFTQELKLQLASELQAQIGYGGLIHQFKNFVLRGEQSNIDAFKTKYQQIKIIFTKYRNVFEVSTGDIKNIEIIEEIFDKYNQKLAIAIKLKQQFKTADEIDFTVKVDDNLAIVALNLLLKGGSMGISPNYWWKLATNRINLFRKIENQITANLSYSTAILKKNAQVAFIISLGIMWVIMTGTFIISYIFALSITKPLKKLVGIANQISAGKRNLKIKIDSKDETGKLSQAMRKMLESISRSELMLKNTSKAYSRFVPNECLHLLDKKHIIEIKMGHNLEMDMTILFADIRSFTSMSEKMSPQENFDFINNYLKMMGPIIRNNNGIIDKYIGDAIMALFKNPNDAINAGIAMLNRLVEFNIIEEKKVKIGIGINTGKLMFGVIGEEHRLQCTVISDAVNLASRLENATKTYGSPLIMSQNTLDVLDNPSQYAKRFLDKIKVKGRSEYIKIYEIFDADDPETIKLHKLDNIDTFELAVKLYQEYKFAQVQQLMQECLHKNPNDKAANIYIQRCQNFLKIEKNEDWEKIAKVVTWTPSISVNYPIIDEQHQELFSRIRELIVSIGNEQTAEEVGVVIDFLEEYIIVHFATEEGYMKQYDDPNYPKHKAAHQQFNNNFRQIKRYYLKNGGSLYLTMRIQDELFDWFLHHIKKMDQKLALLLRNEE